MGSIRYCICYFILRLFTTLINIVRHSKFSAGWPLMFVFCCCCCFAGTSFHVHISLLVREELYKRWTFTARVQPSFSRSSRLIVSCTNCQANQHLQRRPGRIWTTAPKVGWRLTRSPRVIWFFTDHLSFARCTRTSVQITWNTSPMLVLLWETASWGARVGRHLTMDRTLLPAP